ncbi:MAG: FliH/SctL family protein [Candidatus Caldatribacterium sp.]|uniref:FliH/SctL family protein n=1 Tax=Candidatus Caldatribacterium sp. TaxID=2282143 RepID=UPI00299AE4EC|nr:FliH/SctL family protein [Candidatus Caldatribacterium sp.]MCX7730288.1 FliH/SctL family protein [Candidatus Caldatribacterium sp.]MDW8080992.1 FliH/SctL family protein [Candidatus Calescibacterium sp.]
MYKRVEYIKRCVLVGQEEEEVQETRETPLPLEELSELRRMILQEARQEARRIVEEAQKEAEAIRRQAYEEGWREGEEKAKEAVQKSWEEKVKVFERILREFVKVRDHRWKVLEEPLCTLVFALAEKVIQREAERAPFVGETIARALLRLAQRERVVVRVHPEECAFVRDMKEDLFRRVDGLEFLEVKEDPRVAKGGCIVETQFGNVDARIETQIAILREEVERLLAEESHA